MMSMMIHPAVRRMRRHKAPTPPFPLETEKGISLRKNLLHMKRTQKKTRERLSKTKQQHR
jgi:hypothetical protein